MPLLFLLLVLSAFFSPSAIQASVSSCTADVSPGTVAYGDTPEFNFHITNPSDKAIVWINISKPSSDYVLTACGGNWSCQTSQSDANFPSVNISAASGGTNGTGDVTVSTQMVENGGPSSDWTVQVSDQPDGSSSTTCTGSLSVEITPNPAIAITNAKVTNVSATSVSVTWTTDTQTSSQVDYGLTTVYDLTKTDDTQTTSHSLILSSLASDATYHANISSTDYIGNSAQSGDFTFTTSASGTVTVTTTTTVTNTVTAADSTGPTVSLNPLTSSVYSVVPTISGQAIDDKKVSSAEYTLDQITWYTIILDSQAKTSAFKFTPGISKSGTYTIRVRARDSSGNYGATVSTSLTIDKTPPVISLTTDLTKPFSASPQIIGTATDAHGINLIELSTDAGINWLPALTVSHTATQTNFSFTPSLTQDGDYPLLIRAADTAGNVTDSESHHLFIDRLPPRVGQFILISGTQITTPQKNGNYLVSANSSLEIYLSIVGGPNTVSLTFDAKKPPLALSFLPESQLWYGKISLDSTGTFPLEITASDPKNTIQIVLTSVTTRDPGHVFSPNGPVPGAVVSVFIYDENTKQFSLWDGSAFGLDNPQTTDSSGHFSLFLPPGKYYLQAKAKDFTSQQTDIFSINQTLPITQSFNISPLPSLKLGPVTLHLPNMSSGWVSIPVSSAQSFENSSADTSLIGKPFPDFDLLFDSKPLKTSSLHQKHTLVSLLPSWSPVTPDQLKSLSQIPMSPDTQIMAFAPQDSPNKTQIISQRLGLNFPYVADPDGELFEKLKLYSTPAYLLVDQRGIIVTIITGDLSQKDLSSLF